MRRERAVARRIREARFAENKALEGFNWQFNPKAFDRLQIEELATGDFIRRRTNLLLVGWSGVGKSHIIQAVGRKPACGAIALCTGHPPTACRSDRFTRRQNPSRPAAPLCESGSVDYR
jgi:hypothetical protein